MHLGTVQAVSFSADPHAKFAHRFPPPWTVEDIGTAFVVRDHDGQQLAHVYFDNPRAKPLTRDEARRIAVNIAAGAIKDNRGSVSPARAIDSRSAAGA